MYRLLEWAFAYDDGSGLPDAGAYAAELKNVTATADGKPVQGFDPTKTGTWTIPAGTQVNIVDMPDDWKLDGKAEQPAGTVVFTASKYGTPVVTWTFKNDSATDRTSRPDPGTDALKNVAATADGKPIARVRPDQGRRLQGRRRRQGQDLRRSIRLEARQDRIRFEARVHRLQGRDGRHLDVRIPGQRRLLRHRSGQRRREQRRGRRPGRPRQDAGHVQAAASPKPCGHRRTTAQAAVPAPLASTGAGTGPAIAVAGLLAMAGASLLAGRGPHPPPWRGP